MSRVPLTKEGEALIKEKLYNLKFVERPQISEAIAEARAHGDLKENAEYHAAKELQGLIEAKITASVTSSAESGLPTKSTIFPIIFPDSIEDDECAKDC